MQVLLEELSESLAKLSEKSSEAELEENFRLVMAARGDNKVLSIYLCRVCLLRRPTGMNHTHSPLLICCMYYEMPALQAEVINIFGVGVEGGTGHGVQDFPGQQALAQYEDSPVVHPVIFTTPRLNTVAH